MSKANQRVIVEELARIGLKPHAIAGILANLEFENGFNTTVNNGDGGQASGIAQWRPDRFARVIRVAKKMGVPPTDIRAQARTLALSIEDEQQSGSTGTTTVKSLNRLKNPAAVAKFFDENYERSAGETRTARMQAASNYVKIARSGGGGAEVSGDVVRKVPGSKDGFITWVPKVGVNVTQAFTGSGNYANGEHSGTDIGGNDGGQPIRWAPPVTGKVIGRGTVDGGGKNSQGGAYGNHVVIKDKEGRTWLLAHMQGEPPQIGTVLNQGDMIGRVGNTGNSRGAHLHIEMSKPGVDYRSGGPVVAAKLKFRVNPDGSTVDLGDGGARTPKGYFGNIGNFSASYLDAPGNEELRKIYAKAKKDDWSEQKVQNAIYQSDWYKTRSQSQRTFDKMTGADQQATLRERIAEVRRTALEMGVPLTKEQIRFEAMRVARDGDTGDQLRYWLGNKYEYNPEKATSGFVRSFQEDIEDMSRAYGYTFGDNQLELWTREAIRGNLDASSYEDEMRADAQRRFPELKLQGRTLSDALAPWMDTAVRELGIDPSEIDLRDPKWTDLVNPETGTMYTNDEYRKVIRTDTRHGWRDTQNGKREFSQAAGIVGRLFGASNYGG